MTHIQGISHASGCVLTCCIACLDAHMLELALGRDHSSKGCSRAQWDKTAVGRCERVLITR